MNYRIVWSVILILALCVPFAACTSDDCDTAEPEDNDLEWNKQIAEAFVHSFAVSIGEAVLEMDDDATRIAYIRRAIDSIAFYPDDSGYFYVYHIDGVNIAHARQKDLQDQNLWDFQDSRDNYVIRMLSAEAQNSGGYVEYWWVKPGETGEKNKLGYVELIPNTEYFIGSGVYLE